MKTNKGQFRKGQTYHQPKPYWRQGWLIDQYIFQRKSAEQIAKEQGCKKNNILYFLKKNQIITRSMKEIRQFKKWGQKGKFNGMYGRCGKTNPNWNGGHSPERQSEYAKSAWRELAKNVLLRDSYKCQICGEGHNHKTKGLVVHHIKAWSRYPELRFELTNLQTLCVQCHKKKHSRKKSIR